MYRTLLLLTLLLVVFVTTPARAQTFFYVVDSESLASTGCIGPSQCLCPAILLGEITGTFQLTFLEMDGTFEVYAMEEVDWAVNAGTPDELLITGLGVYRVDMENSLQEMTLDVLYDGEPKEFQSEGIVAGGGLFPDGFSLSVFHMLNTCVYDGFFVSAVLTSSPAEDFLRGDANGDGAVNGLTDGLYLLSFQFVPGSPEPPCHDAADVDDDGALNGLVDGLFLLNFQFVPGSPTPPNPGPTVCDADPTDDDLVCAVLACP